MSTKRPKSEEIVSWLRQVEVLIGQGMACLDASSHSITRTYNKDVGGVWWRNWQGVGMSPAHRDMLI